MVMKRTCLSLRQRGDPGTGHAIHVKSRSHSAQAVRIEMSLAGRGQGLGVEDLLAWETPKPTPLPYSKTWQ